MRHSLLLPVFSIFLAFGKSEPSKLVKLTVVALDKQDRPVTGLTGSDFRITDNGKPQTIVFFRQEAVTRKQTQVLEPGQYSNQSQTSPHTVVILLDLLNNRLGSRNYGANQIVHALEDVESNANVYLYLLTLNGTLFPVVALPAPGPSIHPIERENASSLEKTVDDALHTVSQLRPAGRLINEQIDLTYKVLSALGEQMARFPGRKGMIWVTHGTPLEIRMEGGQYFDYTPFLARLSGSLDNAGIAVYPVAISDGNLMRSDPSLQTLDVIAALTGGVSSGRDVESAVKQVTAEESGNYVLQYYSPDQKQDGKYHKVKVAFEKKGVQIVSEQGYYAGSKPSGNQQPAPQAQAIADALRNAALMSPNDYTAIPVTATVTTEAGPQPSAHVEVHADISSLLPIDEGHGAYEGQLTVTSAVYEADSQPLVSEPAIVKFAAGGKEARDGVTYSANLPLGGKAYSIRLVVVDAETRAVGSITIPVKTAQ